MFYVDPMPLHEILDEPVDSRLQPKVIEHDWPLEKALDIGDRATGTHVLSRMYAEWKDKPVPVDLTKLWADLGIRTSGEGAIEFVSSAPLANIRESIAGEHVARKIAAR